jgi:hypothetical protein
MTTSTQRNKRENALAEPLDNQMFEREGFDRRGIRREFAGVQALSLDDKDVQQDDQTFVDPRTIDMPVGPTAMGDFDGQGVRMLDIEGDRWPTFRWTQGFEQLKEDSGDVAEQRDAVLELLDFFADVAFLTGIGPDSSYRDGMFDWLRDSISSGRTFDLSSTGSLAADDDRPENVVHVDALEQVDGRLMDMETANWDVMVGSQEALAKFNNVRDSSNGVIGDTYFDALMDDDNAMGGVNDWSLVPLDIAPAKVPYGEGQNSSELLDQFTVNLVDTGTEVKSSGGDEDGQIGTDEVFLLPDMEAVRDNYWRVHEMGEPELFGPLDLRGGKEAYDYAWRYTHRFNPKRRHPNATDAIHLKNVSDLFN